MIENAAKGENWMFRNFYIEENEKITDIYNNGRWSCAILVSSILYLNKLIKDVHANVLSVNKDMEESGWYEIKELKPGAILVWEKSVAIDDGRDHYHIGFYVGNDAAISNDSRGTGFPYKHHYTSNNASKIEKIYWHSDLNKD